MMAVQISRVRQPFRIEKEVLNSSVSVTALNCRSITPTGELPAHARTPRFRLKKSLMQQRPIFTRPWRRGKRLTSAEIKWYRINDAGKEEVYFVMTLEGGKACGISPGMANTKLAQASALNHVESVSMMYDRITWHYLDGNIKYTDSWKKRE
ncbi:type VI secretion system Hcp family effector [Paraburkholderia sp. 35.1]